MATTSRKTYVAAAQAIHDARLEGCSVEVHCACDLIAHALARHFAADNAAFDMQRFYKAAGVNADVGLRLRDLTLTC